MGRSSIAFYAQVAGNFCHLILCYNLIKEQNLGILGVGLANCLTNIFIFILLVAAHFSTAEIRDTFRMPDRRAFQDFYGYLELGLPISLMLCMEFWVYEVMLLLCGLLSVNIQAAYFIQNNIYVFFFCLAMGMQSAGCTYIGF